MMVKLVLELPVESQNWKAIQSALARIGGTVDPEVMQTVLVDGLSSETIQRMLHDAQGAGAPAELPRVLLVFRRQTEETGQGRIGVPVPAAAV
jgi:hypothetical protein